MYPSWHITETAIGINKSIQILTTTADSILLTLLKKITNPYLLTLISIASHLDNEHAKRMS